MTAADAPLLLTLPLLLIASAFFSGSETALFGLSEHERLLMRRRGRVAAAATTALLANPRMLLITVLLGNMLVNVVYFVISSVLAIRAEGAVGKIVFVVGPLLMLILGGEVAPKLIASSRRPLWCAIMSPPMLALHRLIAPLRIVINALVIEPLGRLVRPVEASSALNADELGALLSLSAEQGILDVDEARLLDDVIELSSLRVGDVMTPRVDVRWARADADRADVRRLVRETGLGVFPVCETTLDHGVIGVLAAKRFLARTAQGRGDTTAARFMEKPLFVPEQATLDRLLDLFREKKRRFAVVVDEYGAVAGVVSIGDVIERLVAGLHPERADIAEGAQPPTVQRVGPGRWRAPGRLSVHDWAEAFGQQVPPRVATLGGLVLARLGRPPRVGDVVRLNNVRLQVESVRGAVVENVLISTDPSDRAGGEAS